MRDLNPTSSRAVYDAGRADTFDGVPIHHITPSQVVVSRLHDLVEDCWCEPVVERAQATRVRHRDTRPE